MPSKKRKYNARFPAGRIKKIMQTDEEVGKVAQAVPIIISTPRTLELFVESLMSKAMQVTMSRNAKTLSPSHVKQCILAESRFDFLRDLVKNIPDVSAAEEKELMSAESSPNSSRFPDNPVPPRKIVREDSNSSSSCDVRVQTPRENLNRVLSVETELPKPRIETVTSTVVSNEAIDLTTKKDEEKTFITANFYHETLIEPLQPVQQKIEPIFPQHRSVIQVNPTYASPQPSTSTYANMTPIEPVQRVEIVPKQEKPLFFLDIRQNNNMTQTTTPLNAVRTPTTPVIKTPVTPVPPVLKTPGTPVLKTPGTPVLKTPGTPVLKTPGTPVLKTPGTPVLKTPGTPVLKTPGTPVLKTPVTPILNIDFSKSLANPEIKVLDNAVANIVGVKSEGRNMQKSLQRQSSKDVKKDSKVQSPIDIDHLNSGNLQIDEDYDT